MFKLLTMKTITITRITFLSLSLVLFFLFLPAFKSTQSESVQEPPKLQNPITVDYIKKNLKKSTPRLVLTPAIEKNLRNRLKTDPVVQNYYRAMKIEASEIIKRPELERVVVGRRLLSTSREMLRRMTILGMIYRIDGDREALNKIDRELKAVCGFQDWNPSHFLDVAEMSLAVAIAIDWTGHALPAKTVEMAKNALIEKGLIPSETKMNFNSTNNWNQVCNGGMIAASIAIAEKDPELAAKTIKKSLDGMPNALKQYIPDGVYPEGATYWDYGTSFSCVTSSILTSAFGTDFGLSDYPGFLQSAIFKMLMVAPSGYYFNFADCGDRTSRHGDIVLAWFAQKTGNSIFLEKDKFLLPVENYGGLSRLAGIGLIWLSQFEEKTYTPLPINWMGDGTNPVVVFRGGKDDNYKYYFGGKGGRANLSHGNMDAGTFIFELNDVRWVIDPGNQDYNTLEQAGFDLWNQTQNSPRWTLLTKGNHGHSNLTVNNSRFKVDASARIIDFKDGEKPEALIDLTPLYNGKVNSAIRKFIKDSDHSITIEDKVVLNDSTTSITWALMTTAEVIPTSDGANLMKDNKYLNLKINSPAGVRVSTIMLDPPPLVFDKRIEGIKRIEIRIPAYIVTDKKLTINVRLSAPEQDTK